MNHVGSTAVDNGRRLRPAARYSAPQQPTGRGATGPRILSSKGPRNTRPCLRLAELKLEPCPVRLAQSSFRLPILPGPIVVSAALLQWRHGFRRACRLGKLVIFP
jgi:hypothetical protein